MAMQDLPGGPGRFATRDDLGNVKKIQREGKNIAESSGGPYGSRKELTELSQGASTQIAAPTVAAVPSNPLAAALPVVGAFAPGTADAPLSNGAPFGPGEGTGILQTPVDSPDQGAALARAMFFANPTPQLARIVEAYNEMGV